MEEKMNKIIALAVLSIGLAGCWTQKTAGKKFGVSLYKFDDVFISSVGKAIQARKTETGSSATINLSDAQGQQATQNDSVDTYIAQGYNALGINMVDRTAASVIIDKAKAADIPIVFFNREPVSADMNSWDKLYYVGARAEESGRIQGEIAAAYFKNNAQADKNGDGILQYVMIEGEPGHQDAILRTEYSIKALQDSGVKVQKLASDTGMWQRVNGQEKMSAWLTAYGDQIELVLANNDDMALGAIEALRAAGYFTGDKFIPVIGVDASAPALDSIKNNLLYATVLNNARMQGYAVFDLMDALVSDKDINSLGYEITDGKYIWVPYVAVTRDNYKEFQ